MRPLTRRIPSFRCHTSGTGSGQSRMTLVGEADGDRFPSHAPGSLMRRYSSSLLHFTPEEGDDRQHGRARIHRRGFANGCPPPCRQAPRARDHRCSGILGEPAYLPGGGLGREETGSGGRSRTSHVSPFELEDFSQFQERGSTPPSPRESHQNEATSPEAALVPLATADLPVTYLEAISDAAGPAQRSVSQHVPHEDVPGRRSCRVACGST